MADEPAAAARASAPPPLSDQYHKGRKGYALFSGLLLAWVLAGIQVDVRNPVANISVSLATPDMVPIILTVLVLYFAFRTYVEWYQCDDRRRALMPSRIDFVASHIIGISSIFTYGIQQTVPPWLEQLFIDKAPTVLILLAIVLFVPYGKIVQDFISKGFYKGRWYGRTPITRLLTFSSCWSVAQSFYVQFAVASVMGNQILQKGNNTYPAILMASYLLFLLGYSFHEIPFARLQLFRSDKSVKA